MQIYNNTQYTLCDFKSVMNNTFSHTKTEKNKGSKFIPNNSVIITPNENDFIGMNNRREYQYYEKK